MQLHVDVARGPYGDSEPCAFRLGTRALRVVELIDRWLANDHSYYKLRASDDHLYILRHDTPADTWELTLFQADSV